MAVPSPKFYLVHAETGQRYPIADHEVTLGRSSGEILYPQDDNLAPSHCRLIWTGAGLGCQDLGGAGGTEINGARVAPGTTNPFNIGDRLKIGRQEFVLHDVSRARRRTPRPPGASARPRPRRRRRGSRIGTLISYAVVVTLVVGAGALLTRAFRATPPLRVVDAEVDQIFERYRRLGEAHAEQAPEADLARQLRRDLIPDLGRARARLGAVQPADEHERRYLEIKRRLVDALLRQTAALADTYETPSPAASAIVRATTAEVAQLSAQARALRPSPSR